MTVLIDTQVLLWMVDDASRLSSAARAIIEDKHNHVLLSIASAWEISIKLSLGNLNLSLPLEQLLDVELPRFDVELLAIHTRHLTRIVSLPHHHRDPFDRLIVAQALAEAVPVISIDRALDAYGVDRIW